MLKMYRGESDLFFSSSGFLCLLVSGVDALCLLGVLVVSVVTVPLDESVITGSSLTSIQEL